MGLWRQTCEFLSRIIGRPAGVGRRKNEPLSLAHSPSDAERELVLLAFTWGGPATHAERDNPKMEQHTVRTPRGLLI